MASYVPCEGSGRNAVNIWRAPSQSDGLGMTRAKTFGDCPVCGRVQMSYGLVTHIKVNRHKAQVRESEQPVSPYVADTANPTDEELSAAVDRGVADGSLIDAGEWMARHAAESTVYR